MATVALTGENFNQYVEKEGVLVIDWWAPWCGPCRTFGPIYDKASENHSDITFGKVNTEDQPELAGTFQIQAIPTLMVFRDQVLVFARPGAIPAPALEDLLTQVKALDMDDIRRQIAAQEEGQGRQDAQQGGDPAAADDDRDQEEPAQAQGAGSGPPRGI